MLDPECVKIIGAIRTRPTKRRKMALNSSLHSARRARQDEFYTQLGDIENELRHYKSHFADKTVYCNCDDPTVSNFFHYFSHHFVHLGLKRLITTCYKNRNRDLFSQHDIEQAIKLEYDGFRDGEVVPKLADIGVQMLEGDGDFRSVECVEILKRADIVVTNPPFSLFREYIAQLIEYKRKFIVIGPWNAVTYKEIFPLIQDNRVWLGYGFNAGNAYFGLPPDMRGYAAGVYDESTGLVKFRNVTWFTNLDHRKRHDDLILYQSYTPEDYPKYDNYDAIEITRIKDIPMDYEGVMGVPITFLDKHNPEQFEIVGTTDRGGDGMLENIKRPHARYDAPVVDGRGKYKRIFIRNRKPQK